MLCKIPRFKLVFCIVFILFGNTGCMREINKNLTLLEVKKSYYQGNFERSFRLAEVLAREGDIKSQYTLGYMHYYGIGVPQNVELGIAWIKRAAEQGYPEAIVALNEIDKENCT